MTILIEPLVLSLAPIDFGRGPGRGQVRVTNSSSHTIEVTVSPRTPVSDWGLQVIAPTAPFSLAQGQSSAVEVTASPESFGHRSFDFDVTGRGEEMHLSATFRVSVESLPPRRSSLFKVDLPANRHAGTQCEHWMLAASERPLLQALVHQGATVDWYTAVSTGTRRRSVSSSTSLRCGEVFLSATAANSPLDAMINGFDIQDVYMSWLSTFKADITDPVVLDDVDTAMRAAIGRTHVTSRHSPIPQRLLGTYLSQVPAQGEVVSYPGYGDMIVVSPPEVSARLSACFRAPQAILIEALEATAESETTFCTVLASKSSVRDKSLLVYPYTPSLWPLDTAVRNGDRIADDELSLILERLAAYLGV